jgi:hypothetical protein
MESIEMALGWLTSERDKLVVDLVALGKTLDDAELAVAVISDGIPEPLLATKLETDQDSDEDN